MSKLVKILTKFGSLKHAAHFLSLLGNNLIRHTANGTLNIATIGKAVNINNPRNANTSTPILASIGMCKNPTIIIPIERIKSTINNFLFT